MGKTGRMKCVTASNFYLYYTWGWNTCIRLTMAQMISFQMSQPCLGARVVQLSTKACIKTGESH